jgi:ligand-binding SRPBCC domain-containing protein
MIEGRFKSFKHQHIFTEENRIVIVKDVIEYETPFGILGKLFDKLILKKYLTNIIAKRNEFVKNLAETQK